MSVQCLCGSEEGIRPPKTGYALDYEMCGCWELKLLSHLSSPIELFFFYSMQSGAAEKKLHPTSTLPALCLANIICPQPQENVL